MGRLRINKPFEQPSTLQVTPYQQLSPGFPQQIIEKIITVEVPVERIVEKIVTVEVPTIVEKIVEVPVEIVREIIVEKPVEKVIKIVDEIRFKELERQIKNLKEEVQYNAFAVVDARQELLEVKNRPTNIERLEKSLNSFKNKAILFTILQALAGLIYLALK